MDGALPHQRQHREPENECSTGGGNDDEQVQPVGFILEKGDGAKENWRTGCPPFRNPALSNAILKAYGNMRFWKTGCPILLNFVR